MRAIVSEDTIDEAVSSLQARGEENQVEVEPIVLAQNVSLARARRFMAERHQVVVRFMAERHQVVVRYVDGSLIAVEVSSGAHGRVIMKVMNIFDKDANLNASVGEVLESNYEIWQSDGLVEPRHLRNPGNRAQPSVIIEVGDYESLQSVFRCATHYLNNHISVRLVLCIKMWGVRRNGSRALLMLLFDRNNMLPLGPGNYVIPREVISYGNAPLHRLTLSSLQAWGVANIRGAYSGSNDPVCDGPNQSLYQVVLPADHVYHGSTLNISAMVQTGTS